MFQAVLILTRLLFWLGLFIVGDALSKRSFKSVNWAEAAIGSLGLTVIGTLLQSHPVATYVVLAVALVFILGRGWWRGREIHESGSRNTSSMNSRDSQ